MADMAERLDGMVEELTDMALDALQPCHLGRPRLARGGRGARRSNAASSRARRALERAVAVLGDGASAGRDALDDGA